jgi:DNA-binding response OmpR family regulator
MNAEQAAQILVVEDDPDIRESIVEVLEDAGYRVSAAGDGRQALEVLEATPDKPRLILLDLMMPVMNGFQFREEQLARAELAAIPVLVITADANAKAESLEAAGLLQKPLKIQPLLDRIKALLRAS